jgi:hypothetical protein
MRKNRKKIAVIAALAALVLVGAAALDNRLRVLFYTVETEELSIPVDMVLLTDLHSCAYGEGQLDIVGRVRRLSPKAVLLAGDIVDDKLPEENAWITVDALAAEFPCFYVTGNHEWWSGEAERICARMEQCGVTVLRGEGAELSLDSGETLRICGIDDPDSGLSENQLARLSVPAEGFTLLLAHRPERIDDYLQHPFDLIVSGHAHGGQWRLPGLVNGLFAPHQGLFPRYAGGQYAVDGADFIVSRGLARESTKIPRLFNRPELVVIQIIPK